MGYKSSLTEVKTNIDTKLIKFYLRIVKNVPLLNQIRLSVEICLQLMNVAGLYKNIRDHVTITPCNM